MQKSCDQFGDTAHSLIPHLQLLTGTPCLLLMDVLYGLVTLGWYVTAFAERLAYRGLVRFERSSDSSLEPPARNRESGLL